ncbi:hypothetical protein J2S36_001576 [Arcanobacterium hippocoleae]|uniref:Uncharacterized protein n=1 Tax=Arcanobacterium hippocoleae TaxID=149017 RepID=A0ABU1T3Z5_9ACTO|nr:hypothetical protein [Arcanobacterium hippocoleae]
MSARDYRSLNFFQLNTDFIFRSAADRVNSIDGVEICDVVITKDAENLSLTGPREGTSFGCFEHLYIR